MPSENSNIRYLVTYAELQSVANAIREVAGTDLLTNTGEYYTVDKNNLIDLANAIRTTTGTEASLEWPVDFITQIKSLYRMTIPAGTTIFAFPQDYIDIIKTGTTEKEYHITVNLYHIPEETSNALYGKSPMDAFINDFSGNIRAYIDDILSKNGDIYQATVTGTTTSSSATIDISTELNDLYSKYGFTDDKFGIQYWDSYLGDIDRVNKKMIIDDINEDCVINTIFFNDDYRDMEDVLINIHVIYVPSSQTCEQLIQAGLISQGVASLCNQFHQDVSLNPMSPSDFQTYLENFRQQADNDASEVLFEFENSLVSQDFSTVLIDSIEDISQQVQDILPSTVLSNITFPIDTVIFLNVDPDQYNVIDSSASIQYLDTPVKYLINVQKNHLNAEDIVLSDAEDDQTIIALLIEDEQIAEYGLQ